MYRGGRNQRWNTDELKPYRLCILGLDKERSLSSFVRHPKLEISMEPSAALQSLSTLLSAVRPPPPCLSGAPTRSCKNLFPSP